MFNEQSETTPCVAHRSLLAAVAALALALAPGLADARAGGGGSLGSRGSMTWSAPPSTRTAPYGGAADAAQHDAEHPVAGVTAAPATAFGYRGFGHGPASCPA